VSDNVNNQGLTLAAHLGTRRESMLREWREAIRRDPTLATSDSLPKVQLVDHIPAILSAFENQLNAAGAPSEVQNSAVREPAAAHGLLRWQQGYDLREVTRELGKLNECVVAELRRFTDSCPSVSHEEMARAYALWSKLIGSTVEESVNQYFELQQQEAVGQVKDLESAVAESRALEEQQGDLWRQAAHDLRGNLGVVANATVGLTNQALSETARDKFTRLLMRNVTSLHQLLDDVTSLARLQAGRELRRIQPLDVTPILQQLCDGIGEVARQRNLYLRAEGPAGFGVDGDAVKIARIAQNLILNAVKYTHEGGVVVSWGDSSPSDAKRWVLAVTDSGPGFHDGSGEPIAQALGDANEIARNGDNDSTSPSNVTPLRQAYGVGVVAAPRESGEGIGLSIVKRLCELLDATIEMTSTPGVGTTFRILFPRTYAH
jgi:signal transduction histidine kinase